MRRFWILGVAALLLAGCQPIEQSARDGIATAGGAVFSLQQKYKASCQAQPAQETCVRINRAVDAHNLALDALNLYCSGSEYLKGGACQPNREWEPRLREAIARLQRMVEEVRGL